VIEAHLNYLRFLVKHKYWVIKVGRKMGLPWYRVLKHDLSKLLPSEWFGYVKWKNEQVRHGGGGIQNDRDFGWPWFLHMKRNDHHWQYFIYTNDNGQTYPIEILEPQRTEMLVDWASAGIVRFGEPGMLKYYKANKDRMIFHPTTRLWVEATLEAVELAYASCEGSSRV
jgi:hypothetical protein